MDTPADKQTPEVTVRRVGEGGTELAVFEFQGELRELMLSGLRESYLTRGNYTSDAKAVSSQTASSLGLVSAAAGAAAISTAFSPTLYMATADPSTLMSLGNGVGSAVMGPNGIVSQAPFTPVAMVLPIIAPVLAVQALNAVAMMREFKKVDRKLDGIKSTLDNVIARIEATHAGELLAASRIVDDVYSQYETDGAFSNDMLTRLAVAERDVKALAARFRQLVNAHDLAQVDESQEAAQANYDAHSAMLASFVELRVAFLRVCVDMQENPKSVKTSIERLKEFIDDGIEFWQQLQNRSRLLKDEKDRLETELQEMSWSARRLPGGLALKDERDRHAAVYEATMESEREIMRDFHLLIDSAKRTRDSLQEANLAESGTSPTLVYWRDEAGEYSFVTDSKLID